MSHQAKDVSLKEVCEALGLKYDNLVSLLKLKDEAAAGAALSDSELLTEKEEEEIGKSVRQARASTLVKSVLGACNVRPSADAEEGARDARILDGFSKSSSQKERRALAEILRGAESDLGKGLEEVFKERIKGQDELAHSLLIALVLNEHCLLEGLPGVGKTEIVKWIANVTGLPFSRVQFIPDMLPSDLIGKDRIDIVKLSRQDPNAMQWVNGPIFSSIILADEINRAPSKVQAALLESMGERQVTPFGKLSMPVQSPLHQAALELWPLKFQELFGASPSGGGGEVRGLLGLPAIPANRRDLAQFTVFATMNPIEQEGTYPLSEAQTDRFCFKVIVPYPSRRSYLDILEVVYSGKKPPEAIEFNLSVGKCRQYFEKHPGHMIPVLIPLYFLLKCRAQVLPVRIGQDEWKTGGEAPAAEDIGEALFRMLSSGRSAKTPDRFPGRVESSMLQKLNDIVYMTNARMVNIGESQSARRWYDKEQIEMRQYISEQDERRRERLSRIFEEEHCQYVKAGGSPRAFLKLVAAALCEAFLEEREEVKRQDIIRVVDNVLRHRIHMDVHARMAGIAPEDVIHKVCEVILAEDLDRVSER